MGTLKPCIDYSTNLIIVLEKYRDLNGYAGYSYEYTTIDPKTANIIQVDDRKQFIDYNDQYGEDLKFKIKWKSKRVKASKGNERIEIEIYQEEEEQPLSSLFNFAFSKEPHKSIPDLYKYLIKIREESEIQKAKSLQKYLEKDYDERVKYWAGNLGRQMRWNVESGFDEYAVFSKPWLEEVKNMNHK